MRTILFAPCILDTRDRINRNHKWLDYYIPLKDKLGYDKIVLVDNASPTKYIEEIENKYPNVHIVRKKIRLERIKQDAYPYWYRAFAEAAYYAIDHGYDKIIHIDTDVFVFSDKLCTYLKDIHYLKNPTWTGFYCNIHQYNETIFQVCAGRENIDKMYEFMSEGYLQYYPFDIAERRVPFTHIEKNFIGDRFPERGIITQDPSWDWCGQVPVSMKVKFND